MFGIWGAFMPVGTTLAVVVTPILLAHGGWRGLWLFTAAISALLAAATAVTTRALRPLPPASDGVFARATTTLRAPGTLAAAGVFGAYAAQYLAVTGFLPTLLTNQHHLPASTAALLTALVTFVNAPGNLLGGWLRGHGAHIGRC